MADIADLNPAFSPRLDAFRDALAKEGINTSIASGYRSPEYQSQLYGNYQAKQAGRALPYPNVNKGSIAAAPWQSFHNYGLAADVIPTNSGDYQKMWAMAPQFGLHALGQQDIDHFQMAGDLGSLVQQYNLAGWRPASQPAPSTGAIAYSGPSGAATGPSRPVTPTPGTTLNSPMDLVANLESGNRNIAQQIHDKNTDAGTPAGGFFQIIDPTWQRYAGAAGVDLKAYPTAMSAPRNIQAQVASAIPVNQWGANTVAALKKQYPGLDTSQTLGQVQSAALGGSAPSSSPAGVPGVLASASGGALPGFGTKAASDQFLGGLKQMGITPPTDQPDQQQQDIKPSPIMQGPGLRNYPGPAGIEAEARQRTPNIAQQLYGQTLNSQPLAWSNQAIPAPSWMTNAGAQASPQGLGTSLNSLSSQQMAYGLSPYQLQMMMNPMMLQGGGNG